MALNDDIEKFKKKLIKKQVEKYKEAGKSAMREMKNSIIREWFGGYKSGSMIAAGKHYKSKTTIGENSASITIITFFDVSEYTDEQNIHEWNRENKIGLSKEYLMEYVMRLQLHGGIIGLPEGSTHAGEDYSGFGWKHGKNEYFVQKIPLERYLFEHSKWSLWKQNVQKHVEMHTFK